MAKLYPIHPIPSQPEGHRGILMSWLWTAITFVWLSHTAHLSKRENEQIHNNGSTKITMYTIRWLEKICLFNPRTTLPWYIFPYGWVVHRHHGNGCCGWEPIRLVISTGIITNVVEIAEHKWHGVEASHTGTGHAYHIIKKNLLI